MKYREDLLEIYSLLLERYGYRNWWPSESNFETIIGAILTQNVSWKNAKLAVENLRDANYLDLYKLEELEEKKLAELIRSARFYNQKAKKIKVIVKFIIENYDGRIELMAMENIQILRKNLLSLWGFGEETVDSIILYSCNLPIFVIDSYTKRIFSRLGLVNSEITYSDLQDFFMSNIPSNIDLYNDYHAQIVHLGNICCKKAPLCDECPLHQSNLCTFFVDCTKH